MISYLFVSICESSFSFRFMFDSVDFRNNWFVNSYLMLLLLTPIMEKSLANIQYDELKKWIILLCIFNIVFVFLFRNLNDNGYNVIQFIFLYYIARFLKLGYERKWCVLLRIYSLPLYILAVISLSLGFYFMSINGKLVKSIVWFGYNQPLVLILSIAFFMSFAKLRFCSNIINRISTGVFGVFVLHTTIHIIPIRNVFAHFIYSQYGYLGILGLTIIIFLLCLVLSIPCSKMISKAVTAFGMKSHLCEFSK